MTRLIVASNITTRPHGNFRDDGKFVLTKPLTTRFGIVPIDFVTDGFTIYKFLRWFHAPFGQGLVAAIWHDYALSIGRISPHKEFFLLLIDEGISRFKASIMFLAVTLYDIIKGAYRAFFYS